MANRADKDLEVKMMRISRTSEGAKWNDFLIITNF